MDAELVTYYKLQMAHDLIMFLGKLCVHGLPPESQIQKINQILESWDSRVETQVGLMRATKVKEACADSDKDFDVQTILADIAAAEPKAIRKEFKIEARHSMLRPFKI